MHPRGHEAVPAVVPGPADEEDGGAGLVLQEVVHRLRHAQSCVGLVFSV